jgi:hypothetical protein
MVSLDERRHRRAVRRSLVVDKGQHARIHSTRRAVFLSAGRSDVFEADSSSQTRSLPWAIAFASFPAMGPAWRDRRRPTAGVMPLLDL